MNPENETPNKYKRYDEAFKRSAVELWLQGGKSVQTIATELGISTQSLKQWKKQLAALPATGLGQRSVTQLEDENRRLRREVAELLAKRFPDELAPLLPPKRELWENEDARMDIFDAVGLAVVSRLKK